MRQFITFTLFGIFAVFLFPQFGTAQLTTKQLAQEKSIKPDRKFIIGVKELGFGSIRRIDVGPYIGYKLNKHFTIGAEFRYSNSKSTFDDSGTTVTAFKKRIFGYGVFGRYTVNPKNRLSVYTELSIGHNFINTEDNVARNGASFDSSNWFSSRLGAGLKYKINDRLNILLDVRGVEYNFSSNTITYDFGINSLSPRFEIKF